MERCVDVQPGWQVGVVGSHLARPLMEDVLRLIARRGAYAVAHLAVRPAITPGEPAWVAEAPPELLTELPPVMRAFYEQIDADVVIYAPENTRDGSDVPPERLALARQALAPVMPRFLNHEVRWVSCMYPTPALAQDAGMTTEAFEEFLYGACLRDWEKEAQWMRRIADRFDVAKEVRVVGAETDITFSLEGRHGKVDAGDVNLPAGEVFYSPIEDSAQGVVTFSEYPAWLGGRQVQQVRVRFERGRVVEASSRTDEDFLLRTLDTDDGARVLGEFGIGCNAAIARSFGNPLFDEKIYGTVHFALGAGFPELGGTNVSAVHWDMVKDLREGGEIWCDGELVQKDGEWSS